MAVDKSSRMDDLASMSIISDFLNREGGLAILIQIDTDKGTLHNDFNDDVHISRATVTKRIEEAKELNLIEQYRLPSDHGNAKRYKLTQMGRVLRVALESMNLDETYSQYLELQRELDQSTQKASDWVREVVDQLDEDIWISEVYSGEFSFAEKLRNEDIYPGDDVPEGFTSFIEEPPNPGEQLEEMVNLQEKEKQWKSDPDEDDSE